MTLLPANSTVFERETEASLHKASEIDVDALKRMRDPWACSASHLPFLAWGRGVDLWYEDWPEFKKRRMTAQSYTLKGMKGTLPGADAYLSYVDASIVEAVVPPRGVIARAQDPERNKRFRERFAEIRLYPFATRGQRPGCVAKSAGVTLAIAGTAVAHGKDIGLVYGRQAVLRDHGIETPIRSVDTIRVEGDLVLTVTSFAINTLGRSQDAVAGRAIVGRMIAGVERGRLITIGAGAFASTIPAGFEGVDVLNASPERVFEQHGAKSRQPVASAHPSSVVGSMIARRSEAGLSIYDRWHLFDRDRAGADPYQTLGPVVGRMIPGLTPAHAFLRVDARFLQRGRSAMVGRAVASRVVARPVSDKLLRVGAAIYRSKRLRDTVRFTTRTHRPIAIGDLSFETPTPFQGMVPLNRTVSTRSIT